MDFLKFQGHSAKVLLSGFSAISITWCFGGRFVGPRMIDAANKFGTLPGLFLRRATAEPVPKPSGVPAASRWDGNTNRGLTKSHVAGMTPPGL